MDKAAQAQVDLETKIAFLERACEELNEVILDQSRSIEGLEQRLGKLESRAVSDQGMGQEEQSLADQRPPHY